MGNSINRAICYYKRRLFSFFAGLIYNKFIWNTIPFRSDGSKGSEKRSYIGYILLNYKYFAIYNIFRYKDDGEEKLLATDLENEIDYFSKF